MREAQYEPSLVKKLEVLFPGCVILKNDASYRQGVPDRIILHNDKWAMLEVKASENAPHQPNQPYYVDLLNSMSFAAFVYPENEEHILDELQRSFRSGRPTRVFRGK